VEKLAHLRNIQARLRERAGLINAVRAYFNEHGFMEVETPVVIAAPAPEEYIEGIAVEDAFLRTSPELQMKQMLCAGYEKIYQVGPCFRKNEFGSRHRPEFTMLEWYETGSDYFDLLDFTVGLLRFAARRLKDSQQIVYQGETIDLELDPQIISVREAFEKYAGINPDQIASEAEFDEIMSLKIEPCLGKGRITFLADYPAERAALARLKKDDPAVAERWELYIAGIELANAYGELLDPHEQRRRFEKSQAIRAKNGFIPYPFPDDFMKALETGMPECSGCALGIDRLAMIFTDSADISDIRT